MRPNFFVNTPDINPIFLQTSGRPGFRIRLVLAATPRRQLRHLQRLRALRGDAGAGQGGVPQLREVRDQGLGLGPAGQHPGRHPPAQPAPARAPGAAGLRQPHLLQRLERQRPLLRQDDAADRTTSCSSHVNLDPHNGQGADFEVPLWEFGLPDDGVDRGRGPGQRQPLHLARQDPALSARPAARGPTPSGGSSRPESRRDGQTATERQTRRARRERRRATRRSRDQRDWYKDAIIYQLHVKAFQDANGDGIGDFAGLMQRLDYIAGARRQRDLADAVLPLAAARRRLRHRRLPRDQPVLRHDARLPRLRRRGAPARPPRHHRARHQPHLRPASLVPAGAARASPARAARDYLRLERHRPERYPETRIIFIDTEKSNWTWDPVAKAFFWHRFYSHQPDLNFDNPRVLAEVLKRLMHFWLDMGVDGLRLDAIPYLVERDGTNNENLPETHDVLKAIRAEIDRALPRPHAARRGQPVAGGHPPLFRRRRRMPHGASTSR